MNVYLHFKPILHNQYWRLRSAYFVLHSNDSRYIQSNTWCHSPFILQHWNVEITRGWNPKLLLLLNIQCKHRIATVAFIDTGMPYFKIPPPKCPQTSSFVSISTKNFHNWLLQFSITLHNFPKNGQYLQQYWTGTILPKIINLHPYFPTFMQQPFIKNKATFCTSIWPSKSLLLDLYN